MKNCGITFYEMHPIYDSIIKVEIEFVLCFVFYTYLLVYSIAEKLNKRVVKELRETSVKYYWTKFTSC